jgi:hypothetical protein
MIMQLTGDPPGMNGGSWDPTSLMMGMGMGGGMRSVPPTAPPHATVAPGQTLRLPTNVVSLNPPSPEGKVVFPARGEQLELADAGQVLQDARLRAALVRLASEKAPETVTQLVLWHLGTGMDWASLAQVARGWANSSELALARSVVSRLDKADPARESREAAFAEDGTLYLDLSGRDGADKVAVEKLAKQVKKAQRMLGLTVKLGGPARPEGPSLAAKVDITGQEATVQVLTTDARGATWASAGKFALATAEGEPAAWADRLAEGVLSRVVRVQLTKGPKVKAKDTYRIRIENASPFVLAGLAVAGLDFGKAPAEKAATVPNDKDNEGDHPTDAEAMDLKQVPSVLAGLAIPPRKNYTVGATTEVVERLGLKAGVKLLAADLNGL